MTDTQNEPVKNELIKISANLVVDMGSEENASIFINSYEPEVGSMPMRRSAVDYQRDENYLNFNIKAADITAFRASINSLLQFIDVVDKINNFIEEN
ncbi:MAG: KEOPS complex subunit Pcc1 [Promethearchaeota archaeon]